MFWSDSDRMREWLDSFVYRCRIVSIHGGGVEDENSAGRDVSIEEGIDMAPFLDTLVL